MKDLGTSITYLLQLFSVTSTGFNNMNFKSSSRKNF